MLGNIYIKFTPMPLEHHIIYLVMPYIVVQKTMQTYYNIIQHVQRLCNNMISYIVVRPCTKRPYAKTHTCMLVFYMAHTSNSTPIVREDCHNPVHIAPSRSIVCRCHHPLSQFIGDTSIIKLLLLVCKL